mgnify:CR=1 FL=1
MGYLLTFVIPLNKLQSVEHIFNTQKRVLPPLTLRNSWSCSGMLLMSVAMSSCGILAHYSWSITRRSVKVSGTHLRTFRPIMFHTFSMGLRSGLRAGHTKVRIGTSSRYCCTQRATWGRALSCMRQNPSPIKGANGTTCSCKISWMTYGMWGHHSLWRRALY